MLKPMLFGKTIEKAKPWLATISGDGVIYIYSYIKAVVVAPDDSVYACGYFKPSNTNVISTFLVKFNSSGILQWQKMFSSTKDVYGNSITVTADGSVYLTGSIYGNLFLIKLNSSGNIQWQKIYSNSGTGFHVSIAPDNSIYVYEYGGSTTRLEKFDSSGTSQWCKYLSGVRYEDDGSFPLAIAPDGSVYICGHIKRGTYNDDAYIAKFDSSGNAKWQRSFGRGNDYYEKGQSVAVASDGSVYTCGWTNSYGAGSYDLYLVKYDSSGNLQWERTLGGTRGDKGHSVTVAPDDSVYVCGETGNDVLIAKFNSSGDVQWQKTLDNTNYLDIGSSIAVASDGSIYACGFSYAAYTTKEIKHFIAKITDSIIEKDTDTLGSFTVKDSSLTLGDAVVSYASTSNISIYDINTKETSDYQITATTSPLTINIYTYEE